MITINLLPLNLRPVKRTPLPHIASLSVLALTVLGLIAAFIAGQAGIRAQQQLLEEQKAKYKNEGLDKVQEAVDAAGKKKAEFKERFLAAKEILKDRVIWSQQLDRLAENTPDNIWYKELKLTKRTDMEPEPTKDPKTGKIEMKSVPHEYRVLQVSGYSQADANGNDYVYALPVKVLEDPVFRKKFFRNSAPVIESVPMNGKQVSSFMLDFYIRGLEEQEGEGEA